MRLSLEADYGLRIVDFMSKQSFSEIISSRQIAQACCLSDRITLKVLHRLLRSGIISSTRGINGGYRLNKPLDELSYLDVINAIDGKISINKCMEDPSVCTRNAVGSCKLHKNLLKLNCLIEENLKNLKFNE